MITYHEPGAALSIPTEGVTIVSFTSPTCIPCKVGNPVMDLIASGSTKVHAVRVNVLDNPDLAKAHHVKSIPTLLIYKDGEQRHRVLAFAKLQSVLERL